MNEFDLIATYFRSLTQGRPEAAGLEDDAAVFRIPAGHELVVTSDTLNAGTHFPHGEAPALIAHKALRANLSDLAAMGATPYAYQLCIAFPQKPDENWAQDFTAALLADQDEFGLFCSGGDTSVTQGPLSISITAFGLTPEGKAVRRCGARPNDAIVLTGPVGDAFLGLQMVKGALDDAGSESFLAAYRKPVPRTALAGLLQAHAHAAIDISDGLAADLAHLCHASNLSAHVRLNEIRFSEAAEKLIKRKKVAPMNLITGGDDYELLLAIAPENEKIVLEALSAIGLRPQSIGRFTQGAAEAVFLDDQGMAIPFGQGGYRHF